MSISVNPVLPVIVAQGASPDLVLQTLEISVEEIVRRIVELMKTRGYLREPPSRR